MNKIQVVLLVLSMAMVPVLAQAAPPSGPGQSFTPPPPPPKPPASCTYSHHTCHVSLPDLDFVVSKINGIKPSSSNDCKLLPPCGHRPPLPDDDGPPKL